MVGINLEFIFLRNASKVTQAGVADSKEVSEHIHMQMLVIHCGSSRKAIIITRLIDRMCKILICRL
jgi:hypothetical protein